MLYLSAWRDEYWPGIPSLAISKSYRDRRYGEAYLRIEHRFGGRAMSQH